MISLRSRVRTAAVPVSGLVFGLLLAVGIASPAAAQNGGLLDQLFGNSERMSGSSGGNAPPAQGSQADLVVRIERLEAQIRQLTGANEQLQYRNHQLEAQIQRMGGTVGTLPTPGPAARTLPPAGPPSVVQAAPPPPVVQAGPPPGLIPPAPIPGRRSDAFDPTLHPNAPGAPRTLGAMRTPGAEPPPIITAEPQTGVPGGRGPGTPLDLSTLATGAPPASRGPGGTMISSAGVPGGGGLPPPPARNPSATGAVAAVAPPSNSPRDYYDLGYGYVLRKDYALAEQTLEGFLQKYPKDRLAPDAQFWLGESLFHRQRYDAAAASFLDLSTKHSGHPKAAEALLRLGQSLAALNQKDMACATLAEVKRKYPRAPGGVKQGVDREQKRVGC